MPPIRLEQPLGSKASYTLNRCSENIVVKAIIIPELELRNVKWHVFGADLVERADDTTLENAPETLNRLGVDSANNVLVFGVVNGRMGIGLVEPLVANPLIRAERRQITPLGQRRASAG
jgi:hypothetical protein